MKQGLRWKGAKALVVCAAVGLAVLCEKPVQADIIYQYAETFNESRVAMGTSIHSQQEIFSYDSNSGYYGSNTELLIFEAGATAISQSRTDHWPSATALNGSGNAQAAYFESSESNFLASVYAQTTSTIRFKVDTLSDIVFSSATASSKNAGLVDSGIRLGMYDGSYHPFTLDLSGGYTGVFTPDKEYYINAFVSALQPEADYPFYSGLMASGQYTYSLSATPSSLAPVPEPGTWAMMGIGLVGMALVGRKKKLAAKAS